MLGYFGDRYHSVDVIMTSWDCVYFVHYSQDLAQCWASKSFWSEGMNEYFIHNVNMLI